jgi:acyl-CoA dehydrogenase
VASSAFVVDADAPGLGIAKRIDLIAPHPLATLSFDGCRIPAANRLGAEGEGFKLAMRSLDIFRTSVAGAALGFGQRALDEAMAHAIARPIFGKALADLPLVQAGLADMATELDAARLQTYKAAWLRDHADGCRPRTSPWRRCPHRVSTACHRPGGATVRRPRRDARRGGRAPVS